MAKKKKKRICVFGLQLSFCSNRAIVTFELYLRSAAGHIYMVMYTASFSCTIIIWPSVRLRSSERLRRTTIRA